MNVFGCCDDIVFLGLTISLFFAVCC